MTFEILPGFAPVGNTLVETHRLFLRNDALGIAVPLDSPTHIRNFLSGPYAVGPGGDALREHLYALEAGVAGGTLTPSNPGDPFGQLIPTPPSTTSTTRAPTTWAWLLAGVAALSLRRKRR